MMAIKLRDCPRAWFQAQRHLTWPAWRDRHRASWQIRVALSPNPEYWGKKTDMAAFLNKNNKGDLGGQVLCSKCREHLSPECSNLVAPEGDLIQVILGCGWEYNLLLALERGQENMCIKIILDILA